MIRAAATKSITGNNQYSLSTTSCLANLPNELDRCGVYVPPYVTIHALHLPPEYAADWICTVRYFPSRGMESGEGELSYNVYPELGACYDWNHLIRPWPANMRVFITLSMRTRVTPDTNVEIEFRVLRPEEVNTAPRLRYLRFGSSFYWYCVDRSIDQMIGGDPNIPLDPNIVEIVVRGKTTVRLTRDQYMAGYPLARGCNYFVQALNAQQYVVAAPIFVKFHATW